MKRVEIGLKFKNAQVFKKLLNNIDVLLIGLIYLSLIIFCFVAKDKTGTFLFGVLFERIVFFNVIIVLLFLANIALSVLQFKINNEKMALAIRIANIAIFLLNFAILLYLVINPFFIKEHLHG